MRLRLIEPPPFEGPFAPGDCWYATRDGESWCEFPGGRRPILLAAEHRDARPMIVVLPDGRPWCLHSPASGSEAGWSVAGELPNVTVHPSIDRRGSWHGWLVEGELRSC